MTAKRQLKVILSIHSSVIPDLPFFYFFPDRTLPLLVDLRKLVKNKLRRKLHCIYFNLLGIHGNGDLIFI